MHTLYAWGFGPHFLSQLNLDDLSLPSGPPVGRVVAVHPNLLGLATARGLRPAVLAGRLLLEDNPPAVGDWVVLRPDTLDTDGPALVTAVLERRSLFARRGPDGRRQVVAANVDTVFLTTSLNEDLNLRRLERGLALAWDSGARPVVLLSKADLHPDPSAAVQQVATVAREVPILALSVRDPQRSPAALLRPFLAAGETVAFIGSSGVGKSTLTNALMGEEVQATSEIRLNDGRGRHTTTTRRLLLRPEGGLLLDTPGMRQVGLWEDEGGLDSTFADVARLAEDCRWRDCQHDGEPGCAVAEALADGRLEPGRWQSYQKLQRELAYEARRHDESAARDEKRRWKRIHQDAHQRSGLRDRQRW